jgi:uncharacterized membrane protein YheB (UPF0754 family)
MTIIIMMVIGGIIGGFTNFLAIKMLFRPYRAYYIGKWRVPFTPGLIPRRRDELAKQLGKMVVQHLLTPESLQKKLTEEDFRSGIIQFAQAETIKVLETDKTVAEILTPFGVTNSKEKLQQKLDEFIEDTYEKISAKYRHQPLNSLIPNEFQEKIADKIPSVSQFIVNKGIEYFSSTEGKLRIQRMFDDFLKERGMLGNMLQMFLGNASLADKIQPELIKFLSSDGTADLLNTLLLKEWKKLTERKYEELESMFEGERIIKSIQDLSKRLRIIDKLMDTPLDSLINKYKDAIITDVVPKLVVLLSSWMVGKLSSIMDSLRLEQIVSEQVETFSVERVEELVLSITSSELQMITYLGFLLGAIIGLLQGILAIFI